MRPRLEWMVVCLSLVSPAGGVFDGGWTHEVDLSAGLAPGAVTSAISEPSAFGLFDGRLRLGAGPRLFGFFGGSDLDPQAKRRWQLRAATLWDGLYGLIPIRTSGTHAMTFARQIPGCRAWHRPN